MIDASSLFNAQVFPIPPVASSTADSHPDFNATASSVGVCFSGGGSRALSCAMGQLRGLRSLQLLDEVFSISSVSGGTWASSIFTYLPENISDDEFFGPLEPDPKKLTLTSLGELAHYCLGQVPTGLGFLDDLATILDLKARYGYDNSDLWQGLVGELVLRRFGLFNPDETNGIDKRYYTWTDAYLKAKGGILDRNKSLTVDDFYSVKRKRPFLIMNSSMFQNDSTSADLIPYESTFFAGIRNTLNDVGLNGEDIGGGLLECFAKGSGFSKNGEYNNVQVTKPERPFTLADIAGISSAAPAYTLEEKHPELNGLVPRYPYWPVSNRESNPVQTYRYADGGSLENLGVNSQLARGIRKLIVFVNTDTAVEKDDKGIINISSDIPPLFGYQPYSYKNGYVPYSKSNPGSSSTRVFRHNKVFDGSPFGDLCTALYEAKHKGGALLVKQTLQVQPQAWFGVEGGFSVDILWVYNERVKWWWDNLHTLVRDYLDLESRFDFPLYKTVSQLHLDASEVNALAHLSCWNVVAEIDPGHSGKTNREWIESMF
jgi:hypothetical protein